MQSMAQLMRTIAALKSDYSLMVNNECINAALVDDGQSSSFCVFVGAGLSVMNNVL